jgi:hypothetical protein
LWPQPGARRGSRLPGGGDKGRGRRGGRHPRRAAQALILNQRLSPRVLDAILTTRAGFAPQKTDEPRCEDDPDNLYTPIRGHDTAKNGFRALSRSLYNWLQMHPVVERGAAAGTALVLIVALRRRS